MSLINFTPGSNGCSSCSTPAPVPVPSATTTSSTPVAPVIPVELHACMGLNACKGHDRFGKNNCAGTGFCATAETHSCHTLNNCRNQGGCGYYGDAHEQNNPGANECAWQGSCAVPINAERVSTQGESKGKSTWLQARKIFEKRIQGSGKRNIGPSPFPQGPPQVWLDAQSTGGSNGCGS
ncbi:MAG: hypothetical protein M3R17_15820 [Bacteroidota bacterium]|nr:hypothetical protein [Bacteroidota bacterium]